MLKLLKNEEHSIQPSTNFWVLKKNSKEKENLQMREKENGEENRKIP